MDAEIGITPEQSQTVLLQQAEENINHLIKIYDGVDEIMRFTPKGFPKDKIIDIVKQWKADLIVRSTHNRTGRLFTRR